MGIFADDLSPIVLFQNAEKCLAEDACLGLAYLLPLDSVSTADACFSHVAFSSFPLQLAAYFYALRGFKQIYTFSSSDQRNMYYIPPHEVCIHFLALFIAILKQIYTFSSSDQRNVY